MMLWKILTPTLETFELDSRLSFHKKDREQEKGMDDPKWSSEMALFSLANKIPVIYKARPPLCCNYITFCFSFWDPFDNTIGFPLPYSPSLSKSA
jgi:hypothetical protein